MESKKYFGTDYSKFDTYDLVGKNVISVVLPDNAALTSRQILQTTCKQVAIDSIISGHKKEGTEVMGVGQGGVAGIDGTAPDWSMQLNMISKSDFVKLQNDKRDGHVSSALESHDHFKAERFFDTLQSLRDELLQESAASGAVDNVMSGLLGEQPKVNFRDWKSMFRHFHCERQVAEWETGTTQYPLGHILLHGTEVQSTQTLMVDGLHALPAGTVFVADRQTAGRGRGSNLWTSQSGSLMTTFSLAIAVPEMLPFVQYLVCWALVRSVRDMHPELNIRIKWPNDVYIDGQKVCGVLCQSSMTPNANGRATFQVYAGFGVNVLGSGEFETINNALCRLYGVQKEYISKEELLARYIHTLSMALPVFEQFGFAPFQDEYCQFWLHQGEIVRVEGKDGTYTITGISPSGYLRAENETETLELHPDGNSFDMKQKFIAVKRLNK